MPTPAREYLAALVTGDHLLEAVEAMLALEGLPEDLRQTAALLSGQLHQLRKRQQHDTEDPAALTRERNRIRQALLQVASEVPADLQIEPPKTEAQVRHLKRQYTWLISAGAYLLVGGIVLAVLLSPMRPVRIEAELLVQRVGFRYQGGPMTFEGQQMALATVENYASVAVPAARVAVDRGFDGQFEQQIDLPQGELLILPLDPVSGTNLNLSEVQLNRLRPAEGAQVVIAVGDEEERDSLLRVLVQQEAAMQATFSYRDSSTLQLSFDEVQQVPGVELIEQLTQLRCFATGPSREVITLRHAGGLFSLGAKVQGGVSLEGQGLRISRPSFYRPVESVAQASILGGEVLIQETGEKPLDTLRLRERQPLELDTAAVFQLERLEVREAGILLRLTGEVRRLTTGNEREARLPSIWEWWWHNRKALVIGLGLLIVGLVFFVPQAIADRLARLK